MRRRVCLPPACRESDAPAACAVGFPPPPAGCVCCEDGGKPTALTLQWDSACGPIPTTVSTDGKGEGMYDQATGTIMIGSGDGKLGSQTDFTANGVQNSIHTSCSAPFGLGVRTFVSGEEKSSQGGCSGPESSGCWFVTEAVSESGEFFCNFDCATCGFKKGSKGKGSKGKGSNAFSFI